VHHLTHTSRRQKCSKEGSWVILIAANACTYSFRRWPSFPLVPKTDNHYFTPLGWSRHQQLTIDNYQETWPSWNKGRSVLSCRPGRPNHYIQKHGNHRNPLNCCVKKRVIQQRRTTAEPTWTIQLYFDYNHFCNPMLMLQQGKSRSVRPKSMYYFRCRAATIPPTLHNTAPEVPPLSGILTPCWSI